MRLDNNERFAALFIRFEQIRDQRAYEDLILSLIPQAKIEVAAAGLTKKVLVSIESAVQFLSLTKTHLDSALGQLMVRNIFALIEVAQEQQIDDDLISNALGILDLPLPDPTEMLYRQFEINFHLNRLTSRYLRELLTTIPIEKWPPELVAIFEQHGLTSESMLSARLTIAAQWLSVNQAAVIEHLFQDPLVQEIFEEKKSLLSAAAALEEAGITQEEWEAYIRHSTWIAAYHNFRNRGREVEAEYVQAIIHLANEAYSNSPLARAEAKISGHMRKNRLTGVKGKQSRQ